MAKLYAAQNDKLQYLGRLRNIFYNKDTIRIKEKLIWDLQQYISSDDLDRLKFITLDEFINSFLSSISNTYDNRGGISIAEDVPEDINNRIRDVLNEVNLFGKLEQNEKLAKLHGVNIPYVSYIKSWDKLNIELSVNVGTTEVWLSEDDPYKPTALAYQAGNNSEESADNSFWIVFDFTTNNIYKTATKPNLSEDIRPSDYILVSELGYNPFTYYKYSPAPSFWGYGMDYLVTINRSINMLWSVLNDDSITESLRILIMSAQPVGTKDSKGKVKIGLRHPVFGESAYAGEEGGLSADILQANLYTDDFINGIEALVGMVSSLNNIPNALKAEISDNLSGLSVRLQQEPLLRQWRADSELFKSSDKQLLKTIFMVNNKHFTEREIPEKYWDMVNIIYQPPTFSESEQADLETEQMKWDMGLSNPIAYVQEMNPEFSTAQAEEYLQNNQDILNQWQPKKASTGGIELEPYKYEPNKDGSTDG